MLCEEFVVVVVVVAADVVAVAPLALEGGVLRPPLLA